jgi:preprotein translocase subunit SecE
MSKLRDKLTAARAFFSEVGLEMRKSSWPERQELVESTVVVLLSMLLLSAVVGVSDKILVTLLKLILSTG